MFDCLLLLSQGRLLYFGAIGSQSSVLKDYFERQGARTYKKSENPAEWLFDVIEDSAIDWAARWKGSEERRLIVDRILDHEKRAASIEQELHGRNTQAAAAGFNRQIWLVTKRNLQNDWRTPSYLYSKLFLILGMVCPHIKFLNRTMELTLSRRVYSMASPSTNQQTVCKASRASCFQFSCR